MHQNASFSYHLKVSVHTVPEILLMFIMYDQDAHRWYRLLPWLCRVLNLFAQLVKNAQNDWDRAALALSTVWALLHKGERVKATLKGLPDFMSAMRSCSEVVENLTQQHNMSKCTVNVHVVKQLEQSSRVVARVLDL